MTKEKEIMNFLSHNVFDPILNSSDASNALKKGVRCTIMRLNKLDAEGKIKYYWSAVAGTDRSIKFARQMRSEGFIRFESEAVLEKFRNRFNVFNKKIKIPTIRQA